jgi:hypothetical protein
VDSGSRDPEHSCCFGRRDRDAALGDGGQEPRMLVRLGHHQGESAGARRSRASFYCSVCSRRLRLHQSSVDEPRFPQSLLPPPLSLLTELLTAGAPPLATTCSAPPLTRANTPVQPACSTNCDGLRIRRLGVRIPLSALQKCSSGASLAPTDHPSSTCCTYASP